MKTCYIAGAGEGFFPLSPAPGDMVIAADGGLDALAARGVTPDLVVGDFDSLGYVPQGENVIKLPSEKDDTDMLFAVRRGLAAGFRRFVLLGGAGGRYDHLAANVQALAFIANRGGRGVLVGESQRAAVIKDSVLRFKPSSRGYISVLAFGGRAEGVFLRGLKYPLENALLTPDYPLGASNEFTGLAAEVEVKRGLLLVIWEKNAETSEETPENEA